MRFNKSILLLPVFIAFLFVNCSSYGGEDDKKDPVFKKIPALQAIKPEQPVKIKLKKNAGGSYSWELSGKNADRIIEVDKKLRDFIEEPG